MKRSMYGTLALGAALLAACSGDPTADLRSGADTLVVTPGFLVIDVNARQSVTTQLLDEQGNALAATYAAAANNGAVVAVAESTEFRPGLGTNRLSSIFWVSALSIDSSSVTFSSGGKSTTVPVLVAPLDVPAVFTPAAPNVNDVVTVTAAGFKFLPTTTINYGGIDQVVTARAADSSSITFRAAKAGAGSFNFVGIAVSYLPSVGINLTADAPTAVGPGITQLVGTDAIATAPDAPSLPADANALPTEFTDDANPFHASADCTTGPGFGFPCRIYKLTVTAAATITVAATWDNIADLGLYVADVSNGDLGLSCDAHGNGAGNFETCDWDVTPGTYYIKVVSFASAYPDPDPSTITLNFTTH